MGLELTARDLDRVGPIPLYRQVADRFQAAIEQHELQPGDALPSEGEVAKTLGISRTVVRDAMDELVGQGLIVKRSGAATRVAEPPPKRRMDTSRYLEELKLLDAGGEHPKTSAFVVDQNGKWSEYSVDCRYEREKATATDTKYLGIETGAAIIRRHFVKYLGDEALQIQRSAIPYDIAKGTVLADPDAQPYPGGTIAELYHSGYRVTDVVEDAWARMPTGDERRLLQQTMAGPVWDIVRVFYVDERAVEASRVIAPTARNVLHFKTNLR